MKIKKNNLLNYKYLVKLIIEIIQKYKMTENNKVMIYLKKINKKFDKYIKSKKNIKNLKLVFKKL